MFKVAFSGVRLAVYQSLMDEETVKQAQDWEGVSLSERYLVLLKFQVF